MNKRHLIMFLRQIIARINFLSDTQHRKHALICRGINFLLAWVGHGNLHFFVSNHTNRPRQGITPWITKKPHKKILNTDPNRKLNVCFLKLIHQHLTRTDRVWRQINHAWQWKVRTGLNEKKDDFILTINNIYLVICLFYFFSGCINSAAAHRVYVCRQTKKRSLHTIQLLSQQK